MTIEQTVEILDWFRVPVCPTARQQALGSGAIQAEESQEGAVLQPCAHLRYSHFAFPTADVCRAVVAAVVAEVDESQVVLAVGFAAVLNTDLNVVLAVAVQV